ncbi:MAG: sulfurtransferase complex subunit TusB [Chromatiaceae bacterium]|nr:sulfurtransferase complex subunit TusB [Chromatiaceae bacterium]
MSILHTVNKSPFERDALESCLTFATEGAAVLLFEDGIYAALRGTRVESRVREAMGKVKLHVMGPDLRARGLGEDRLIEGIEVVDYSGFVDLATQHDKVQAWL